MKSRYSQYVFLAVILLLVSMIIIYGNKESDVDLVTDDTRSPVFTSSERAYIAEDNEVSIYIDDNIGYLTDERVDGYMPGYIDDVFARADIDVSITDDAGEADGRLMAVTDTERAENDVYTAPLMQTGWAMYIRDDIGGTGALKGVVVRGCDSEKVTEMEYDGRALTFAEAKTADEALEIARAENLDFIVAPRSAAWLALDGSSEYIPQEEDLFMYNVCIVMEDNTLYGILDKCISESDRHYISYEEGQRWFDGNGPYYMKNRNEDIYMLVLIIFTSVMIAFFIYYQTNKNLYAELEDRMGKLTESKKELKTTFNGVNYYLAELDLNGTILDINRYFFDKVKEGVAGKSLCEVLDLDEENSRRLQEKIAKASRDEFGGSEEISLGRAILEVDIFPIEGTGGGIEKLLFIGRDITKEVTTERQMLQDNKMIAVGQLAAGVAHEIRNPLGIIRNYCYVLKNMNDNRQIREDAIEHIEAAVVRSGDIINNLLNFSRVSSDQEEMIDVEEHIRSLASLNDNVLRKKNIKFNIVCEEKVRTLILVESLNMILINLVQNAVDAMKENGNLLIKVVKYKREFKIEVQDTGTGIEEDILQNIFNPFFTTKEGNKGNGLGLYIVYNETGKLNGKIDVHSEVGVGSVFTLTLPLREDRRGETQNGEKELEHTGGGR